MKPEFTVAPHPEHDDIVSIQSPNAPHCDAGLEQAISARSAALWRVTYPDGRTVEIGSKERPMTNTSGVRPLDNRVLVKPDNVEKTTKGGIILIDTEKEEMAQVRGTLIAAGVNAWAEAAATSPKFEMPLPGTRVLIAKYGGIVIDGIDGEKYRIMNDADITGVLDHGA